MEAIGKSAATALIAYTAHYGAAKFYDYFCVPDGLFGFLQGAITAGSPICQAGIQIVSHTQISYTSMILMGITRVAIDLVAPGSASPKP